MEKEKLRYSVSGKNIFTKISVLLLALAILFRLIGCWGFWNNQTPEFIYLQIILPVAACVLFAVVALYMGKKLFFLSFIPVLLGAVFFVVRAFSYDSWIHTILSVVISIIAAFIYTGTVFGGIRTKWLLLPLFGLPLAYDIGIEYRATILARQGAMPLGEFLPELSALCMMAALFFICFAMKKRDFTEKTEPPTEQETIDTLLAEEAPVESIPVGDEEK